MAKESESRFFCSTDNDIDFYKEASSSKNTKKGTKSWMNVFNTWAKCRDLTKEIFLYEPTELNELLKKFYVEVRKADGLQYEPSCLRVMMASIDRYLQENKYKYSICRDEIFKSSRQILEGVARTLRKEGKGKLPNRARSLSDADVEELWKCKQFGASSPRSLIQTIWWNNCLHFGMRSREEHYNILLDDFEIRTDKTGKKFISFEEGLTKTRKGGLNFKPRKIFPRMYETGDERCPIALFTEYVRRRPFPLRSTGPFYLAVIDFPVSDIWYKNSRMGINTVDSMVSRMKKNSSLHDNQRKYTNHSARKTCARILREGKFQKCEIKNVTGHASAEGLDAYDSGDDDELRNMSLALHPSPSSSSISRPALNPVATTNINTSSTVHPFPSSATNSHPAKEMPTASILKQNRFSAIPANKSNPKFSFGVNFDDNNDANEVRTARPSSSSLSLSPTTNVNKSLAMNPTIASSMSAAAQSLKHSRFPSHPYSFSQSNPNFSFGVNFDENIHPVVYNNCTFNYGMPREQQAVKRRRLIIESDSDSSQN